MTEWKEYTVQDLIDLKMIEEPMDGNHGGIHPKTTDYVPTGVPFIMANNLVDGGVDLENCSFITEEQASSLRKGFAHPGDVLLTHKATMGRTAIVPDKYPVIILTPQVTYYRIKEGINKRYLKYYFDSPDFQNTLSSWANSGSTRAYLGITAQHKLPVVLPSLEIQDKIASILSTIDDKIQNNKQINRNLEDQLKAIFIELFGAEIDAVKTGTGTPLGELIDVIDNRGKTPPLTTETSDFPIIDVGALRGNERVVDFNNCTKFVDEDTYNNWFRSGHPKPWDILLSTVGSLAEMKIFLGEKGCIAQNVVALRSKAIAPIFLYQYLNYIRNDLVAYNIGSVQPSIKVTHIIKHPIFVPDDNRLAAFEDTAKVISDQIYKLYCESEVLKGLRDSLLPKLMSGELDVSDLDI